MAIRSCKVCSKRFDTDTRSPWNKTICSDECKRENWIQHSRAQQERKRNTVVKRSCRECGKEVVSTAYCVQHFCGGKSGECRRKFLSRQRMGRGNPAYRNGFAIAGKRTYTGKHLRACSKYRKAFLDKWGYPFCEVCKINQNGTPKFEVHHIYFASLYPKHPNLHDFRNLIHICIGCHNAFHGNKMRDVFERLEKERGLRDLFAKTVL